MNFLPSVLFQLLYNNYVVTILYVIKILLFIIFQEKPVLNKRNDTHFLVLAFGTATTIQSIALRGHPIPFFKWFQQPIRACAPGCKPDSRKWRRVPRSVISPSAHVPSRISNLFLPPARSGYFFRCVAENSLGHDDVVYLVHRIGEYPLIDDE